jgi:hypothetical protein
MVVEKKEFEDVGGLCVRRDFMGGYAKGAETF